MIPVPVRATAAQTPGRFALKTVILTVLVAGAALVQKEGLVLALLLIFSGVTGPAIRIMTLRTSGIFDRIMVSPVNKPAVFLLYTGIWSTAVLSALVPAVAISLYLLGPALLVPIITGSILAASIGTLSGLAATTLGDAHLYAILATAPLVAGTLIPGPWSLVLPFSSLSMNTTSLLFSLSQIGFLGLWLMITAGMASRM